MRATRALPAALLLLLAAIVAAAPPIIEALRDDASPHQHGLSLRAGLSADSLAQVQGATAEQADGGPGVAHLAGGVETAAPYDPPEGRVYPTGTTSAEPTVAIAEDGTIFTVGVELAADVGVLKASVLRSRDQGETWQEVSPRVGQERTHLVTLDPYIHLDDDTGRLFTADVSFVECAFSSFSDDQGETWTSSSPCGVADHQNVFTGPPTVSATSGYPNVVYYCAIDGGAAAGFGTATSCLKSLDGGLTWLRTGGFAFMDDPTQENGNFGVPGKCGGETGHGVADAEGTIYLPRGWCGQPYLAISHDEGSTWERVQVADSPMAVAEEGLLEHEAGVDVDADGNIYYTWTARNRLPYLAVSTDGGHTWSEPQMIGPPGLTEATLPGIDVGEPGRIAVVYMGSTNAPGGEAPNGQGEEYEDATWNGYLTTSVNALDDQPIFYTASVNDPADPLIRGNCPVIRCAQVFDFVDVEIAPDGTPWAAMVDACPAGTDECLTPLGLGIMGRLVGGPPLLGPLPEPPVGEVERLGGATRLETAVGLSQAAFESSDVAVLARDDEFPDALAASGLAAEVDAPVLLTPTGGLDGLVAEELQRLGVEQAYLMGGAAALSEQVEADLAAAGIGRTRIGGAERFETAALIADEIVALGGPLEQAIVALGARDDGRDAWPDALAAGNLAAATRAPVLLTRPEALPGPTAAALERLLVAGDTVFVAGGVDAVGAAAEQQLSQAGYAPRRLAGADRYATAVAIVEEALARGAAVETVLLVSGEVFADALVAGPAAHRLGGVMVLVDHDDLDASVATGEFLEANAVAIASVIIVGGIDTISEQVADQVRARLAQAG